MTEARQRLGRTAEELVARRLTAEGWRIVERNARTRTGELDIVALDGETLVFVEVKAGRAGSPYGPERPAHAVGPRKRAKVRRLAREWLGAGRGRGLRFGLTSGAGVAAVSGMLVPVSMMLAATPPPSQPGCRACRDSP